MRFDPNDMEPAFKKVALEQLEMATRAVIHPEIGNRARFDILPHICDNLIVELRSYVWTEVLQNETVTLKVEIAYPATWWQHFKQRWLMAGSVCRFSFLRTLACWMLHRWPVVVETLGKEQTHQFKTVALLPEFKYESPSGCGAVVMRTTLDRKY